MLGQFPLQAGEVAGVILQRRRDELQVELEDRRRMLPAGDRHQFLRRDQRPPAASRRHARRLGNGHHEVALDQAPAGQSDTFRRFGGVKLHTRRTLYIALFDNHFAGAADSLAPAGGGEDQPRFTGQLQKIVPVSGINRHLIRFKKDFVFHVAHRSIHLPYYLVC